MTTKGQALWRPRQKRTAKEMHQTYYCIQYSNRPNLNFQKQSLKKNSTVWTHHALLQSLKQSSLSNSFQNSNQHNAIINYNKNFQ